MKRLSLVALVLSFVMGQAAFATATSQDSATSTQTTSSTSSSDKASGCGCADRMHKMMSSLNLDATQQTKINAIKSQLKETLKSNWDQMKSIRSQIHELVTSDTMDDSKLNSLIDQKKELLAQMMKAKIKAKQQIYSLLNTQQKSQFKQMMQQWEEKRMHHQC
ncbi:Spy/CpxP family protein refolding chaperone [Legionella cardiaca]|uniref:Spy/CpxP family protein refolding chaperone n=1 Tax=Legionella cardiaca TaxID=1071983 RepID=A0ABY8AVJ9_9GAMM|nr:Spy/CpxP family protein refolding chaperone [Legionella cardiaca]WED44503.1 Spy/CpxP family protein refolding chaperone [Legionella cardiaca]